MTRFETPLSFEAVDLCEGKCAVDLKDVSKSRKELWLIRAPLGFDGTSLNGVTLDLDGDSVEFCSEGDHRKYEALSVRQLKENEGQSPYLLLPSQADRMLEPGPELKGQIVIMESFSVPSSSDSFLAIKQSEAPKMPEGLRQRYKPFASGQLWSKIHQESTHTDEFLNRLSGIESDGNEEIIQKPEKVKKAKRKQTEAAEQESKSTHIDDIDDGASPRKKKKKKKNKEK